jgi:gas vesicle protein GvpL/GvpF
VAKYVYGVVRPTGKLPEGPGIAGTPVQLIATDDIGALVSDLPDDELRLGREEIQAHTRVLDQALVQGTVLPMRFGVLMEGPDEVRHRLLEQHAGEISVQLEELSDKVEVNIRAVYDEQRLMGEIVRENEAIARLRQSLQGQPDDAAYYGRIQLGELVAEAVERTRERDVRTVIDSLVPPALAVEVGQQAHERVVLSGSFLVERHRLDELDVALETLASRQGGRMRFKYTGPLPPHSFVEFAGSA